MTTETPATILMKGCGKVIDCSLVKNPNLSYECGTIAYCPICKAKIQQYKEDLERELEYLKKSMKLINDKKEGLADFMIYHIDFLQSEIKILEGGK